MSRVLLVGKGAPDRGGIPSFLDTLRFGDLSQRHEVTFLNVAHMAPRRGGGIGRQRRPNPSGRLRGLAEVAGVRHRAHPLGPGSRGDRDSCGPAGARCAARGCGVIVHAHGGNIETWLTGRRSRLIMRLAMRPAHRVVAVWSAGQQALAGTLGDGRVRLIDNGVDPDRYAPPETGHSPPRVLYVGLLTPRKGVLDLIEASEMLRKDGLEHELWLLGGTPDEGPAAAVPVLEASEGTAVLLGTRPPETMPAAYASADIFCLPSWWEAMPLSILEAMAAGLPVVATDVGDVSRAVEEEGPGTSSRSSPQSGWREPSEPLLTDPELRTRFGVAARAEQRSSFRVQ